MKPKTTITAQELLHAPCGHPKKFCGTGVHRDKRRLPKGGRNATQRQHIKEW
jgi:hypothetical protein